MTPANIIALQQENIALKSMLQSQQEFIQTQQVELENQKKRIEQYAQAYDQLQFQVKELLRNRFGRKSERYIETDNRQLSLFGDNTIPDEPKEDESKEDEPVTVPAHQRKKRKSNRNSELSRRIEIIPVSEEDKHCGCGRTKQVIRYETKELLHYKPAEFEIVEQRREVVACRCEDSSVQTAPAPLHILPKAGVTEEFLAFLIVSKINDRQPLYHLEKQLASRYSVDCTRRTMANWMIHLIEPLQPVYNLLKDALIGYDIASCDATTLQVLHEPGRDPTTKSYLYCMRGGPPNKPVVLYAYNDREHKRFIDNWFEGFKGNIHMDADEFFELLTSDEEVNASYCNAHARRKFEAVATTSKRTGLAKHALNLYKKLYKIERFAKEHHYTPEQRYELRQEKSKPIMLEFKAWLDEYTHTTLPKSPLGKAFAYTINHWAGLILFLEDGRLEIDNNHTEREIKPFVIARKGFLFADSVGGAHALAMHFSLLRSAIVNKLEPYRYYVHILKNIPHCKTVEDCEKLLPWNVTFDGEEK